MALGLSFMPGQIQNGNGQGAGPSSGSQAGVSPVQTAIKLLSLRLPSQVSPSAITPQQNLQGQGSAALGGGESSIQLLQRLLAMSRAPMPPQNQNISRRFRSGPDDSARPQVSPRPTQQPGGGSVQAPQGASPFDIYQAPQPESVGDTAPYTPKFANPHEELPPIDDGSAAEKWASGHQNQGSYWDLVNDFIYEQAKNTQAPKTLPTFTVENENDANWMGNGWYA